MSNAHTADSKTARNQRRLGTMTDANANVTVRIGNGTKLHPAVAEKWETNPENLPSQPRNRVRYVIGYISCGCPNGASGNALQRASIVNAEPNCRGRLA